MNYFESFSPSKTRSEVVFHLPPMECDNLSVRICSWQGPGGNVLNLPFQLAVFSSVKKTNQN